MLELTCIMKRIFVLLFIVIASNAYSQTFKVSSFFEETNKNGTIKGMVLDQEADNLPLGFTTITVKETNISTQSDIDGSFTLHLKPGNYTLVYSFVGYKTVEVENVKVTLDNILLYNQRLNALVPDMPILVSELK